MSATVFKNNGMSYRLFTSSPGGTIAIMQIGDFSQSGVGTSALRSIITECSIQEASNANVMYAADGHVYMHVPGDKVGALTISGLAFAGSCADGNAGDDHLETGLERVLRWYRKNRVARPEANQPIQVTLSGGTLLKGHLGAMSGRMVDAATRLQQFSLSLYMAPEALAIN